jgi:predicted nucleotidyltransferase component of viral defense system
MLTQPQVQRFAAESGLRDIMIAEKEVVLTYLLQLLSERGLLAKLAFKGGTCLRKMIVGSQGRFSTDLDFTGTEEHDHEDVILEMMGEFETPFHGITFGVPDSGYYESEDGISWGVNPTYTHAWNQGGGSEIKIQVSRRETPTLTVEALAPCEQSYFRHLPFKPVSIDCLALPEILAEKIRACLAVPRHKCCGYAVGRMIPIRRGGRIQRGRRTGVPRHAPVPVPSPDPRHVRQPFRSLTNSRPDLRRSNPCPPVADAAPLADEKVGERVGRAPSRYCCAAQPSLTGAIHRFDREFGGKLCDAQSL